MNLCDSLKVVHGENRNATEYCLVCHNPREKDVARRPAGQGAPEGIDFSLMNHRLHTGNLQSRDYTIFGFGNTPINFNDVVFPGEIANCQNCHLPGTDTVPIKATLDVTDPRGWLSPVKPATAACTGCHVTVEAASHALANTSALGESCAACHGEDKDFAVSKVHAR